MSGMMQTMSTDPSSRMLRLLTLLQTHRFWAGGELADRLDVSPRTLRRDVDRLRELGYPVSATRGAAGGYQLQAGSTLPPLLLDDDEAVAIAVGLRTAAGASVTGIEETSLRALAKLEQVLPKRLRRQVSALGTYTDQYSYRRNLVDPDCLTAIAAACRDQERLQFGYQRRDEETSDRAVEPHRLVNLGQRWYLLAFDTRRDDWRTFRVDRMTDPRTSGARFTPRNLPGGDAVAYVQRSIRGMPTQYVAEVLIRASPAQLADQPISWRSELTDNGDGTTTARVKGDHLGWLAASIGMIEPEFDVLGPPELIAHLHHLGERFRRIAATG